MSLAGDAYAGAMTLAAPALRVSLRARVRRGKEVAARLGERRGLEATPRPPGRLVWLHAASVGETVSILPVLDALRGAAVTALVTTGTVTSATLLRQRRPDVLHRFVPLDVPGWVARFLDHWRPDAGALVESELWPNLLAACRARGVPLMLLNARLSARSAARWRRMAGLAREMLAAITRVEAQSEADAARFVALGAPRVAAPGNLKYAAAALPCDAAELARLAGLIGERPVWLAASTHPGEEAIAAAVHRRLAGAHPGLLTIVAPRHPERGARLANELGAPRRSAGQDPGRMWVADTLGELGLLYRLAPVVFMGRSLLPPGGGQNPLEPARLGCAIAIGPLTGNFEEPVAALAAVGGIARVRDDGTLAEWVGRMLRDTAARERAGAAARVAAGRAEELPRRMAAALLELAGV
jgi:3-deoxy-D-manno-octulosonic-acid transferase